MSSRTSPVIFVPVETPTAASRPADGVDDAGQFRTWVESLSVLDQQLLRDHANDPVVPDRVLDLFRYAPVPEAEWVGDLPARTFYPQQLLHALGIRSDSEAQFV